MTEQEEMRGVVLGVVKDATGGHKGSEAYADALMSSINTSSWLSRELLHIIVRYRKTFLEIATVAGADTSGIDNPNQIVRPHIDEYALQCVKELRQDYDDCTSDVQGPEL